MRGFTKNQKAKTICIPVPPEVKQRPRVSFRGGRAWAYTPKETKAYEEMVKLLCLKHFPQKLTGHLELFVVFYTKKSRADIDNLLKAFMDGLQGVAYANDSQVDFVGMAKVPPLPGQKESIMFSLEAREEA